MNRHLAAIALVAMGAALAATGAADTTPATAQAAAAVPASAPAGAGSGSPAAAQASGPGKGGADAGARFTHFRVGNKNVKAIYADGEIMWVATSGGLIRYEPRTDKFKLYDATNGLLSNGIFFVGRIQGRITVGTYGGGMSILDEKTQTWENYNIPEGLGDAFVYGVLEASNGDIWIATWSGVNRVRGGKLKDRAQWELHTVESTKGGLPNDWVYGLAEGKNGEIWLATEGGMARFANARWESWNHARGIGAPYAKVKNDIAYKNDPSQASQHHAQQKKDMGLEDVDQAYNPNYIVSLAVDADGTVWAGTWGGGVAHFDGTEWRNLTTAEGLPGNHVFMLHRDRLNRLWIGTNNGLARRKGDGFEVMKVEDGLFANAVFSMATLPDGSLWIGSYGGVAHIVPR